MSSVLPKVIVKLEALNLVFRTSVHRPWTWREVFVKTIKDPLELLPGAADRIQVCKNIDLEIKSGERVALIGVNGVGKTSLCRCIAGYYRPTSGRVTVQGETRALFDVAVGIQPELTGRENAELLAELMFPQSRDKTSEVKEALEFSELGSFLDVPFKLYSKGMQARLGLSLSAMRPSDLLILDEVFDGADQFFRDKIAMRMLQLVESSGAVIFVSHAPEQIRKVCNRLLILHQGQIAFDGSVDEGLRAYEQLRPRSREAGAP